MLRARLQHVQYLPHIDKIAAFESILIFLEILRELRLRLTQFAQCDLRAVHIIDGFNEIVRLVDNHHVACKSNSCSADIAHDKKETKTR